MTDHVDCSTNRRIVMSEGDQPAENSEDSGGASSVSNQANDTRSESSGNPGSGQSSKTEESYDWLRFTPKPDSDPQDDTPLQDYVAITVKYLTALVFGGAVLLGSIASTGSLLVLANAYTQDYSESGCQAMDGTYTDVRYNVMLMLMTCLLSGEAFTFMYSIYRVVMKGDTKIEWRAFFLGFVPEILDAVGLTFLVIFIIPNIDSTLAVAALTLVGAVPAGLHIYAKHKSFIENAPKTNPKIQIERRLDFIFAVCALVMQLTGIALLCWQVTEYGRSTAGFGIATAFCLVCISFRYWENFVSGQRNFDNFRFKTGFSYAIIRSAVIVGLSFFIYYVVDNHPAPSRMSNFTHECAQMMTSLWYAVLTNALCGLGVFYFGRLACQTMVQIPSYSLALVLATVVLFVLTSLNSMCVENARCGYNASDMMEYFLQTETSYAPFIRWRSNISDPATLVLVDVFGSLLGLFGLVLLTPYLWRPKNIELERTEIVFVKPIYGGVLINPSMMMNLRQYLTDFKSSSTEGHAADSGQESNTEGKTGQEMPKKHRQIYLCATMWHETKQEMMTLLKSILRLEKDQKDKKVRAKDRCSFQVHIMFDDSMKGTSKERKINEWVVQLLTVIPQAEKLVFGEDTEDQLFVSIATPYGGRIEHVLPAGSVLSIHLKDKSLIRHRKRWSQCMYFHYILNFLQQTNEETFKVDSTYILALDGDVDFKPKALYLLLERMERNPDVAAACGRIHPVGSGPVAWFQKFEYAIGHWLQKTTEHVLGCVLCSPGCFTLFRGKALMSEKGHVIGTYCQKPEEAQHHIQWDQGEDRWLCTLLLKLGKRIEYCAASDSYTFCPEKFKEFYNQRKRWGPSTLANIFDILMNASRIVKKNNYISWGYVVYQSCLMVASLLGPATVIMMVEGGFQFVFGMDDVLSLILAVFPVVIFVIICFTANQDFQILVAGILTIAYSFVMLAVLVGIIGLLVTDLRNPIALFMITLMSMYTFSGLIHPTEAPCLLHGALYYLCIPSAFIFLMIYSLCNLDDVSWGTREANSSQQQVTEGDIKSNKEECDETSAEDTPEKPSEHTCGCSNFCRISFCWNPKPIKKNKKQTKKKEDRDNGEKATKENTSHCHCTTKMEYTGTSKTGDSMEDSSTSAKPREERQSGQEPSAKGEEGGATSSSKKSVDLPEWIAGETLQKGAAIEIKPTEKDFWNKIIEEYLYVLEKNENQEKVKEKLRSLRNEVAGGYIFFNGLWITLTFFLNLTISSINISYVNANGSLVQLQPVAFIFLLFYIVILLIQFLAMLLHRWSTFIHLVARTPSIFSEMSECIGQGADGEAEDKNHSGTTQSSIGHHNKAYNSGSQPSENDEIIPLQRLSEASTA